MLLPKPTIPELIESPTFGLGPVKQLSEDDGGGESKSKRDSSRYASPLFNVGRRVRVAPCLSRLHSGAGFGRSVRPALWM
ncbi:hypothetical protein NPIL_318681 [Nephila pilipes]|uniref:Uncharacterized protein n=1 Tax=Nephila pilipes TaxID=299642 RepID=A0A8X6NKT2_NEPPI|nr:hypothetical protein NPIL_318681 [Nephila pilipes]